jgi:hypothetical protein
MDEIQTKALRVFLLVIHSSPLQFCLKIFLLQTHATAYSFYSALLYTVKEKGRKPDRKPNPLPYGLRNPYRNLKSENSQDCGQKPQRNCTGTYVHEFGSCSARARESETVKKILIL